MKKEKISAIAKKYGIELMVVFGSVAKRSTRQESDIDIAIKGKRLHLSAELRLRAELFKVFKREIDLVFLEHASPLLLGQIARSGKLVYGKKKDFTAFKVHAMKKYFDFEPYFKLRENLLHRTIAAYAR